MDVLDAFPGLGFQEPVFLTHAGDCSGRVFVAERRGVVRVLDGDPPASKTEGFLDVSAQVLTGGARGLPDVNCAMCPRQGGTTPVDLDLRYGIPTGWMNAILAPPGAGDLGLSNALVIAPGSKETSVLWERMRVLDGNRMPPLGSTLVGEPGVDLVGRWIDDEL